LSDRKILHQFLGDDECVVKLWVSMGSWEGKYFLGFDERFSEILSILGFD